jgi:hypothetical protein
LPKGKTNNPNGRPAGSQNKATLEFKEALNKLMVHAAPELVTWLGEIDDPFKRFEVLSKFAEYIHPKLGRTEVQPLDGNGNPSDGFTLNVNLVKK